MYKLRFWLSLLIIWLFFFYNIERINEPINIASFVYLLVPIAGSLMLLIPRLFKRVGIAGYFTIVLLVYLGIKIALHYELVAQSLPITITEIFSIFVSLFLFRKVADLMWDFEDTIANITFQQIGLPPRVYETAETEDLYREIKRCRRFRRPLTMVVAKAVFTPSEYKLNQVMEELRETMVARYVQAGVAKLLSDELSDSDLMVVENESFTILLPETQEEEALRRIRWLQKQATAELDIELHIGVAGFPEKAVTLRGLIDAAEDDLMNREQAIPANTGTPENPTFQE